MTMTTDCLKKQHNWLDLVGKQFVDNWYKADAMVGHCFSVHWLKSRGTNVFCRTQHNPIIVDGVILLNIFENSYIYIYIIPMYLYYT